jgi:hydrogenase maturation protease
MTKGTVVIGIGNSFRRDDGVGPEVAGQIGARGLPGVRAVCGVTDNTDLVEAWSGAALAVVVDAAVPSHIRPGHVRRCAMSDVTSARALSCHALDLADALSLGQALDRTPGELVLFTVDVADAGHGVGLSPEVEAAVPAVVNAVLAELQARNL